MPLGHLPERLAGEPAVAEAAAAAGPIEERGQRRPGGCRQLVLVRDRLVRHDFDHLVAAVLHELDHRGDGLLTEVVAAAVGYERVGLVDEQHAAQCSPNAAWVLGAVCPTYSPTSVARSTSMRWPLWRMPSAARICPYSRATVVLPVPGLPAKTRWRDSGGGSSPASSRCLTICISLTSVPTSCLARRRPTSASS